MYIFLCTVCWVLKDIIQNTIFTFLLDIKVEWKCGECVLEPPNEGMGKTWGFFPNRHLRCNACKEECEKDDNCAGIACLDESTTDKMSRSPTSCMWMTKAVEQQCIASSQRFDNRRQVFKPVTCWKQQNSK